MGRIPPRIPRFLPSTCLGYWALVLNLTACGPTSQVTPDAGPPPAVDAGEPFDAGPLAPPSDAGATITRISLGQVQGDPNQPESVGFALPLETMSAFLVARPAAEPPPQFRMSLGSVKSTVGTLYQSSNSGGPLQIGPSEYGAVSVLLPNTPTLPFGPTEYAATFDSSPATLLDVTLIMKQSPVPLTHGTLDVNMWFASSQLSAAQVSQDPSLQSVFDGVRALLAQAGISLGRLRAFDVARGNSYRSLTESQIGDLIRTSAGVSNDDLNWFFVDHLQTDDGSTLLDASPGIPGSPVRGLGTSGIVISLEDWPNRASTLASTIAHVTGHWLGLFHTTEASGFAFDPLPDTPECRATLYDKNNDGVVDQIECAQVDASNLMFWHGDDSTNAHATLSPDQKFVLLRHPAVR